ncbi:hypothetical protein [Nocardia sp. NPDC051832]|uniref:hypothetical protein n=1 Tax=Nocardia sp. NPDC051832 TaxID=3155673 RepID=UPI00343F95DD
MGLGDVDALEIAREQLTAAVQQADSTTDLSMEARIQLGLLAAHVALAERLPIAESVHVRAAEGPDMVWDAELITRILEKVGPSSIWLVQILVDHGGWATVEQIKEITGHKSLASMRTPLVRAAGRVTNRLPAPRLVEERRAPDPRKSKIVGYRMREDLLPLAAEALAHLDARSYEGPSR